MTDERADLIRRFYAAWSVNDVDGVLATLHPDIRFEPILGALYRQRVFAGHEEMAAHVREMHERWDGFEGEVLSTHNVDGGTVAFVRLVGHDGDEVYDARIAVDVEFRDGLISLFRGRDIWEAAEELGIDVA